MHQIQDLITRLSDTSSRTKKELILKEYSEDRDILRFLHLTYNPYIRYNINKVNLDEVNHVEGFFVLTVIDFMDFLEENLKSLPYDGILQLFSFMNDIDIKLSILILERNIGCGINVKTINKVFRNIIPIIPFQKPHKNKNLLTYPAYLENAISGIFCNVIIKKDSVTFLTKTGRNIPINNIKLIDQLYEVYTYTKFHYVLLCQLYIEDVSIKRSNRLIRKLINTGQFNYKDNCIKVEAMDLIKYNDWQLGQYKVKYEDRSKLLDNFISSHLGVTDITHVEQKLIDEMVNEEGSSIKSLDGYWQDGINPKYHIIK